MAFERFETIAGYSGLVATVGAAVFLNIGMAVRVAGIGVTVTGVLWILRQEVPIGIEGRPSSYIVRGISAILLGLAMAVVGILLLVRPSLVVCLLGWVDQTICS